MKHKLTAHSMNFFSMCLALCLSPERVHMRVRYDLTAAVSCAVVFFFSTKNVSEIHPKRGVLACARATTKSFIICQEKCAP